MQQTSRESGKPTHRPAIDDEPGRWTWIGKLALVLAMALVVSRCLTSEFLREPVEPVPGAQGAPRGAGAATGVVLDLLSCVPALIVLLQQALERRRPRSGWTPRLFLALAGWACASTAWASDKYAAAIGAAHLVAAGALLWTFAATVREWTALRGVGAVCAGLLLCYVSYGVYYQTVEVPETAAYWKNGQRDQTFRERGWDPESFQAKQFEAKLLRGEMMGFSTSPNTFAAMLVLLGVVTAGLAIQRAADKEHVLTWALPAVLILPTAWLIWKTQSKAAYVTPLLAAGSFAAMKVLGGNRLARLRVPLYVAGVVAVLALAGVVTSYGRSHGNLHNDSLNFRWRYWSAAAELIRQNPLLGVGWNSFGERYLSVRLPVAAEEIKDPHSMFVRAAAELGFVGLAVFVGWLLALLWETTRPTLPEVPADDDRRIGTRTLIVAIVLGIVVNSLSTIDFNQIGAYVTIQIMARVAYLGLLLVGIVMAMNLRRRSEVGARPGPWILRAVPLALGLFLLHNLIDFSLFDPSSGAMMLFAMLAGSAIGMRANGDASVRLTRVAVIPATVVWLAAALGFAAPVVWADWNAQNGDDLVRAGHPAEAAAAYDAAASSVPYNEAYYMRRANALIVARAQPAEVFSALAVAASADPCAVDAPLLRARFLRQASPSAHDDITNSYETALKLNPNDIATRREYAEYLQSVGQTARAAEQFEKALWYNDQFPPDEPKRLPQAEVDRLQGLVRSLKG